ncbi:MAG: Lpp/OprI family alanine-zipper lipoprotein [Sulfuricaulis sp.]
MKRIVYRTLGLSAVLSALVLGAGCATTGDVEAAKQLAQEAKESADQANQTAAQALQTAKEAKDDAVAAQATADSAQKSAQAATAASQQTGEKIDRAFKKSVQK